MKTRKRPLLLLTMVAGIALLASCKKKENEEAKPVSKSEQLAGTNSKKWKWTGATATVLGSSFNLFADNPSGQKVPVCLQDDIITFSANKSYQTADEGSKCTPSQADQGTWAFNSGETTLTLTSGIATPGLYSGVSITIVSLTSTTLQGTATVKVPLSGIATVEAPVTLTFTAQ